MKLIECAECKQFIDLDLNPQTYCHECNLVFCFCMFKTCFCDYHDKNELMMHNAMSICDPTWKVNLKASDDN